MERLELVARQQGLVFQSNSSDQPSVTLQADMFHIEIILNKGGGVKEVKIAHQGEASVSCASTLNDDNHRNIRCAQQQTVLGTQDVHNNKLWCFLCGVFVVVYSTVSPLIKKYIC